MNAFEHFDLPLRFAINIADLRQRFLAIARGLHPDGNAMLAQGLAEERSAGNNSAYAILKNPGTRLQHLLETLGVLGGDAAQAKLPPSFLMQAMELNEALDDAQNDQDYAAAKQQVTNVAEAISQEIDALTTQGDTSGYTPQIADALLDAYLRQRYILRLQQAGRTFAG